MKRSSRPRKTADLSESVHKQLNMYALAAGAAGVGVLALAQPSEAKIVYTPANVGCGPCKLDLNHDGITDFTIFAWRHRGGHSSKSGVGASAPAGNAVETSHQGNYWATALYRGAKIGPSQAFRGSTTSVLMVACGRGGCEGHWHNVTNRYLGLKFTVKGKTHYGWARLSSGPLGGARLTGYAYETIAGKPIIAGKEHGADVITVQPASLGDLAAGASAVPAWRSGK